MFESSRGRINPDITYTPQIQKFDVRLSGRIVGSIAPVVGGWQYVPKGQREGREVYPTFALCQASIEAL